MARNHQQFSLRSVLEKDKLNGTNYTDWIRNLRIVLRAEKKEDVLDTPLPEEPADDVPTAERAAYRRASDAKPRSELPHARLHGTRAADAV